ncbi:bifunctional cystathionine gamma-lyase/homocysteine desulfhydrase [Niallia sp. XMNu-256]|uniref:bifunctional cystathionine gamma-lyase/homocysteine desulfhydrase n=1 Tax=Niallia sp. XMNu-256 TaxID=3082444 RepID=UPI0030D36514
MKRKTKLIHGGVRTDPLTGAVSIPIYQSSTFKQESVGVHNGFEYSRTGNPTRQALETLIAELESGKAGFAFSSGMAAITAVLMLFKSGDHIIFTDDVYGGTFRVVNKVLNRFGIQSSFIDTSNIEVIKNEIRTQTKAIFLETPTNPLLKVTDIKSIVDLAQRFQLMTIVDNTFATPYWQNPLELGVDVVLHSGTKYLGGHSDVVAGLVVAASEGLAQELHFIQNSTGSILGPHDSWLLIRGIKTLGVRMEEHEQNARTIVTFLDNHEKVKKVYYPGLDSHPQYQWVQKQMRGYGSMVSFELSDEINVDEFLKKLNYFTLAESLGAVESLISVPAKMTHASIPPERRKELGISDSLIRISIGLEDADDLIEDLDFSLKKDE